MPADYLATAKQKRDKQQKKSSVAAEPATNNKKNPSPGVLNITTKFEPVKKSRFPPQLQPTPQVHSVTPTEDDAGIDELSEALDGAAIDVRQEISKKLKRLRKKIREIEEIEAKRSGGEKLEKDQQEKIRKKAEVLEEIKQLEDQRRDLWL